jgi:transcription initiation factor TFIIB
MQLAQTQSACPECDGRVERDPKHGECVCAECVCAECGTVVNDQPIDHGPEWNAYTTTEREDRSRVGRPTSPTMHDRGLSTQIDWQDKDANGNSLTNRQRKQMERLRTWNERCQTRTGRERSLRQALGEIHRMSSALGLPQSVRETACVIYRRASDADLVIGRSIEGIATGALYAAARQHGIPRTLEEVTTVARVDQRRISRDYRLVADELALALEPTDPTAYLPRFVSDCGCSETVHRQARDLLAAVTGTPYPSGKHPAGLAAAALYASALLSDEHLTQGTIAEAADVTRVTIRKHYRELLDHADHMSPDQARATAQGETSHAE